MNKAEIRRSAREYIKNWAVCEEWRVLILDYLCVCGKKREVVIF